MPKIKFYIKQTFKSEIDLAVLFESFLISFLTIILYSFYRRFLGISFDLFNDLLIPSFSKFMALFVVVGFTLFGLSVFRIIGRGLLDFVLSACAALCLVLGGGYFSDTPTMQPILFLFALLLSRYLFIVRGLTFPFSISKNSARWIRVLFFAISLALVSSFGIVRHRAFLSSGFDLGIFDQMFYSMSKFKAPITTIEGGLVVNHMTVMHFSPVLYLLLPLYILRPNPETLIFLQCFWTALAIFPLYRLARLYNLSRFCSLSVCIIFLIQPAIFGPQTRDFNENKMLAFFLLSFIYFFEKQEKFEIWTAIFFLGTLFVKDDAFICIVAYCFSAMFRKSFRKKAFSFLLISILYYGILNLSMTHVGKFSYRFAGVLPSTGGSISLGILKVLITQPLYFVTQVFSAEKVVLYGLLLAPLAFIPVRFLFSMKDMSLAIPFLIFNVFQDVKWLPLNAQYFSGTVVLFLLIVIRTLSELKEVRIRRFLIGLMLFSSMIFSAFAHVDKLSYFNSYWKNQAIYTEMEKVFSLIPTEASVSASNHLYPHLSRRDKIYLSALGFETDYVALDLRDEVFRPDPDYVRKLMDDGYEVVNQHPDFYLLLRKKVEK